MDNRYDFVYLVDVRNGNPNGDPDAGNAPRMNPDTSIGLISDVCIKRKLRNYVQTIKAGEKGYGIYVSEGAVLNAQHELAWDALHPNVDDNQVKTIRRDSAEIAELSNWMRANFFDIRTFGAVMSTGDKPSGQVRGAVQFGFAESIEPITPLEVSITRMAVTTEADAARQGANRTMGRKHIVPYALYRAHGFIQPSEGFTQDDLDLVWTALRNMWDLDRSAARGEMSARRLIAFKHGNRYGNARAADLFDRVTVARASEGTARSYADYNVAVNADEMPSGVELLDLI